MQLASAHSGPVPVDLVKDENQGLGVQIAPGRTHCLHRVINLGRDRMYLGSLDVYLAHRVVIAFA